jgi:HPt (histidine-containing phosphotransfer) domain-containing protein
MNLDRSSDLTSFENRIKQLTRTLPAERIRALVGLYLDDSLRRVERLRGAAAGGDCETLSDVAHSLRGSSLHFGSDRLVELATDLEALGEARALEGAGALLEELSEELDRISNLFQDESCGLFDTK